MGPQGPRPKSDVGFHMAAALCGIFAGWVDIQVGDLLLTALLVLAACMLLGAMRPQRPWRWVMSTAIFVPIVELVAYLVLAEKPYRAQIYESFLAFLPAIAGAYGGSVMRRVINHLFLGEGKNSFPPH